ncbi:MAG: YkgJ family cysteine cluster protein [Sedimentisphaerales bacterium]|nr:YkgJ family cysteine cluster protein [Sedimentisphaerales bacterium]MBN2841696.1 YkgJ family cysteine cluster protein [Sedimentisphaerales bacterium]
MLSYCLDCAANDQSCCEGKQIYITLGDVQRIREFGIKEEFHTFEPLGEDYLTGGGDPGWNPLILNEDGNRRILAVKADGNCMFLSDKGCTLPGNVRPLLCRIYPYDFTGPSITGMCQGCPISKQENWLDILNSSQMNLETAKAWVEQLYDEIYQERAAAGIIEHTQCRQHADNPASVNL